jgi:pyrimidine deaminase RibD-like protein
MRHIPDSIWNAAEKQAERSTNRNHRTGCVLINPSSGRIVARGCAHLPAMNLATRTMHAERHALSSLGGRANGMWAVLTTLTPVGHHARCSRPCANCARALYRAGVSMVVFHERDRNGVWHERRESTEDLVLRASARRTSSFARHMKI